MFGYLIAFLAGLVLLILVVTALSGRRSARPARGQADPTGAKPVGPDQPAADAPTPEKSAVAPAHQVDSARRRTPPA